MISDIVSDRLTAIHRVRSADLSPLLLRTEVRTTNCFCYGNRPDLIELGMDRFLKEF